MRFLIGALALCVLGCDPALAECNKPLQLVTSVDLVPTQEDREVLIPVTLAGQQSLLMIDTGGAMTEISPEFADAQNLPRQRTGYQLFNVAGEMSNQFVHASLQLGRLKADNMVFMVAPGSAPFGSTKIGGLLAPDILKHYDVDLDFGGGKFNLLDQDHCDGKVVYWPADAVAVVPMLLMDSGHIQVSVLLDGKPILAALDTGAYYSTLARPEAEEIFGLTMGSPETPRLATLAGRPDALTYRHSFKTLGFEGIQVTNAQVDIIPDFTREIARTNATPETGTHMVTAKSDETHQPMLIGMNILRHFHIYIAYKEHKLYITPAAPPAAAPAAH